MTRRVATMMIAICVPECLGSPTPMSALQKGQRWVNLLKPGRQHTRQETSQEPQRQQRMAKPQPEEEISLLTSVTIWEWEI